MGPLDVRHLFMQSYWREIKNDRVLLRCLGTNSSAWTGVDNATDPGGSHLKLIQREVAAARSFPREQPDGNIIVMYLVNCIGCKSPGKTH